MLTGVTSRTVNELQQVRTCLPAHIRATQAAQLVVVWCCDPMHGNTEVLPSGLKTRRFDKILDVCRRSWCGAAGVLSVSSPVPFVPTYIACDRKELHANFEIHKELGSHLGGVHFELTGDNVTGTVQLHPIPRTFLASGG